MKALGLVAVGTPGIPVPVTEQDIRGATVLVVQARASNKGILYVGRENLDRETLEDVLYELMGGQVATIPLIERQNSTQPKEYFLDAEDGNGGDAALGDYA